MTNYTYLGWGTTDSNGVAKLDHDANGDEISHSYTGVGAGEIDVVAALDKPISSGTIVSTPYPVYDCTWVDKSDATWSNGTYASFSNGVRTFNNTSSGEVNIYANNDNAFTGDLICEFDLIDYYGGNMLRFYGDTGKQISFSELGGVSQGCHIMIKSLNKQVTIFVDGVQKSYNFSYTSNGLELGFRVLANMLTKISNYKVYPI